MVSLLPWLFSWSFPVWPWIVAGVFVLTALAWSRALGPFYQLWMRFGVIMNIIMSRVILGTVFLLTVVPAGLIFKLRGKDLLDIRLEKDAESYRRQNGIEHKNNLNKPY